MPSAPRLQEQDRPCPSDCGTVIQSFISTRQCPETPLSP